MRANRKLIILKKITKLCTPLNIRYFTALHNQTNALKGVKTSL